MVWTKIGDFDAALTIVALQNQRQPQQNNFSAVDPGQWHEDWG